MRLLQPFDTMARIPVRTTVDTIISTSLPGLSTTMLPKPKYTTGDPACKNFFRSGAGS